MFLHECISAQIEVPFNYFTDQVGAAHDTTSNCIHLATENPLYDPTLDGSIRFRSEPLDDTILALIEDEFLPKNYFFNNQILQHLARLELDLSHQENKKKPVFHASNSWCKEFRHFHPYI
jgi:hypothetical protein